MATKRKKKDKPTLGRKLEILRLVTAKDQASLAEEIGMSPQAYSRIESCQRSPALEQLTIVLDFFKLTVSDFYRWEITDTIAFITQNKSITQLQDQNKDLEKVVGFLKRENSLLLENQEFLKNQIATEKDSKETLRAHRDTLQSNNYSLTNERDQLKIDLKEMTVKRDNLYEVVLKHGGQK